MNNGKYGAEIINEICGYLRDGDTARTAVAKAGLSESTFYQWQIDHPEFSDAVKRAQEEYKQKEFGEILNSAKKSLRVLVEGTEYDEVETEYGTDKNGNVYIKHQKTKKKKILPNPTSVIFALTNRDPENWKNRYSTEQDVKVQGDTETRLSLSKVPDDLLEQVVKAIRGESD